MQGRVRTRQQRGDPAPEFQANVSPQIGKCVEVWRGRGTSQLAALTEQTTLGGHLEIKGFLANGHHGTRSVTEIHHPEREILHWKISMISSGFHP